MSVVVRYTLHRLTVLVLCKKKRFENTTNSWIRGKKTFMDCLLQNTPSVQNCRPL